MMDKGRSGQERLRRRTMGCRGPTMTLLPLCVTFLALHSISDAASISPRLPKHMVMTAIIVVNQELLDLDQLSLSWEHNGRPLVEYKNNIMTSHEPRALLPQEKFHEGNFSLILVNITMKDTGNYTCMIQYDGTQQTIQYALLVEKTRIKLIDLSRKKVDETNDRDEQKIKLMKRSSKKSVQQSNPPNSTPFLLIGGYKTVSATPGENISLMCKFHTDPSMELTMLDIRWSKDGVPMWVFNKDSQEDEARLLELSRGNASLKLTSVRTTDSGRYTCDIRYRSQERRLLTILNVQDKSDLFTKPASTIGSPDKYRKEKVGMVVGVVVVANCLVFFIYFFISH
ncbi:uncharacterized protein LOC120942594 [Rana temporaria]|uniref:uncharacterized protein LOC120942594 n=1 Tax=Rana temporaria TaxID=8407 RepID=UPI001AAD3787|nr:uncharacterized protein LOC120942594 [Rana temporaria]